MKMDDGWQNERMEYGGWCRNRNELELLSFHTCFSFVPPFPFSFYINVYPSLVLQTHFSFISLLLMSPSPYRNSIYIIDSPPSPPCKFISLFSLPHFTVSPLPLSIQFTSFHFGPLFAHFLIIFPFVVGLVSGVLGILTCRQVLFFLHPWFFPLSSLASISSSLSPLTLSFGHFPSPLFPFSILLYSAFPPQPLTLHPSLPNWASPPYPSLSLQVSLSSFLYSLPHPFFPTIYSYTIIHSHKSPPLSTNTFGISSLSFPSLPQFLSVLYHLPSTLSLPFILFPGCEVNAYPPPLFLLSLIVSALPCPLHFYLWLHFPPSLPP